MTALSQPASNPFAPHPHPGGVEAVPSVQGRHDRELSDTASQPPTVPGDAELEEMKLPDLRDLAERVGLDAGGKRTALVERLRRFRDGTEVDEGDESATVGD